MCCLKYILFLVFFKISFFLNYLVFWETRLLQEGPALHCRAELHCTALKDDMWHPPSVTPEVPPQVSHHKKKIQFLFSDPILTRPHKNNVFEHPKKSFSFGIGASISISQRSQCLPCAVFIILQSVSYVLPVCNLNLLLFNTINTENIHRLNTVMVTWILFAFFSSKYLCHLLHLKTLLIVN